MLERRGSHVEGVSPACVASDVVSDPGAAEAGAEEVGSEEAGPA